MLVRDFIQPSLSPNQQCQSTEGNSRFMTITQQTRSALSTAHTPKTGRILFPTPWSAVMRMITRPQDPEYARLNAIRV